MNNAAIERHLFQRFSSVFALPAGSVVYGDKPDVKVEGAWRIGIEIARLYIVPGTDPTSEQRQQGRRAKALATAQRLYLASGGKRFEWTFAFNPAYPIVDIADVAGRLKSFAHATESMATGAISGSVRASVPELAYAYLNAVEYSDAKWRQAQPHTVPSLHHKRVRELAASKDLLLPGYVKCDQYWLLLVVDYMDPALDQEIAWGVSEEAVTTQFDRLLIYRTLSHEVTEVPVARAAQQIVGAQP